MKSSFAALAAALALAQSALVAAQASINSPVLVQCQPAAIQFAGGQAPYFLRVLPGGQPTAQPLAFLPNQAAAGTYTWVVNLPAGTQVTLAIIDATGLPNYSAPLDIQASPDSSCLGTAAGGTTSAAVPAPSVSSAAASGSLTVSGTSATVTAATGTPTGSFGTNNSTASSFNFTCPQGLLTYGIAVAELQSVSLSQAIRYFSNWTAAAPGPLINSTGSTGRGVGAQRSYALGANATISETLRLNSTNATTGALRQQWNFTSAAQPIALSPELQVYNAFDDLTVYTNDTTDSTEVQYFILACFDDQTAGLTTLATFIEQSLSYWSEQIATSMNMTAPAAALRRIVKLF